MTVVTRVPQLLVCPVKDHPCKHRDQDQGEDQTRGCTRTRSRPRPKTTTRLLLHQMKELLLSSGLNNSLPTFQNLLKFLPRQKEIKCVSCPENSQESLNTSRCSPISAESSVLLLAGSGQCPAF